MDEKMTLWATVASAVGIGALGAIYGYKKIRPQYAVKVNCWFCGCDTTVPYGNRNCWDCPACEQYNGFNEDGDYNKPIPAQSRSDLNFPVSCARDKFLGHSTVLCDICQQNQLLKVRQLASFIPLSESTFEQEVEEYSAYLERVYDLCQPCQERVQEELSKQDAVLYSSLAKYCRQLTLNSVAQTYTHVSNLVTTVSSWHLGITFLLLLATLVLAILHGAAVTVDRVLQAQLFTWLGEVVAAWVVAAVVLCFEWRLTLLVAGLAACLLSKAAVGKDRLYVGDAVSFYCWLVLFILHHVESLSGVDAGVNLCLTATAVSALSVLSAAWCCLLDRRTPRNAVSARIRRRSLARSPLAMNASQNSETSTTAVSSVSNSRRCRPDPSPTSSPLSLTPTPDSASSISRSPPSPPSRVRDTSPEPPQLARMPGFGQTFRTSSCPSGVAGPAQQGTGSTVRFGSTSVFGQGGGFTRSGSLFRREVLSPAWTPSFGAAPAVSGGSLLGFSVVQPPASRLFQSAATASSSTVPPRVESAFGAQGSLYRRPPSAMGLDSGSVVGRTSIFGSEIPPAKMAAPEEENDLDLEIQAINLGTPCMPRSDSGIFSATDSGFSRDAEAWRQPGQPRPLITPAKLDAVKFRSPTPRSVFQSSGSEAPRLSSLTEDRLSQFNRQVSGEGSGSSSMDRLSLMRRCRTESVSADEEDDENLNSASIHTGTTECPVDSTTGTPGLASKGTGWRQRVWQALVSVSVVGNMFLATYFLLLR